jgi:hypothetical protein
LRSHFGDDHEYQQHNGEPYAAVENSLEHDWSRLDWLAPRREAYTFFGWEITGTMSRSIDYHESPPVSQERQIRSNWMSNSSSTIGGQNESLLNAENQTAAPKNQETSRGRSQAGQTPGETGTGGPVVKKEKVKKEKVKKEKVETPEKVKKVKLTKEELGRQDAKNKSSAGAGKKGRPSVSRPERWRLRDSLQDAACPPHRPLNRGGTAMLRPPWPGGPGRLANHAPQFRSLSL